MQHAACSYSAIHDPLYAYYAYTLRDLTLIALITLTTLTLHFTLYTQPRQLLRAAVSVSVSACWTSPFCHNNRPPPYDEPGEAAPARPII